MDKLKILISFSGGRTSAYMTWWMQNIWKDRHSYEMVVVFANTGREREETLEFVRQCDRYFGFKTIWVQAVINPKNNSGTTHTLTNFNDADRKGKVFEDMIAKYGIPNQNAPHCSRELKKQPIKDYARSIGWSKYETALGIRTDEPKRLNWGAKIEHKFIYFAELLPVTKSDVNLFWSKQPFDLKLKSYEGNCDLCWKKGLRKLMTIVKDKPELSEWWREMESKYGMFIPDSRLIKMAARKQMIEDDGNGGFVECELPIYFYRDKMSIDDIIEESKLPFDLSKDESKDIDMWKQSSIWNEYLDSNNGCTESCEVF
jgi:hypothetical protein